MASALSEVVLMRSGRRSERTGRGSVQRYDTRAGRAMAEGVPPGRLRGLHSALSVEVLVEP